MLNNIDNLNNSVKAVFAEHNLECEGSFVYSQYPELSDIQCNELLKYRELNYLDNIKI